MIAKDRLLAGLQEMIYVEEGMVTLLSNFSRALVQHAEGVEEKRKREIERLLSGLHRDSSRHKEMVESLIRRLETDTRDEY